MTAVVLAIFVLVYIGMATGRVPGLAIDRAGMTFTGLVVLLLIGALPLAQVGSALELPTLLLLFALMIVAGHAELAGVFDAIAQWLAWVDTSPRVLLALVIAAGGVLSAILVNDIVAFALTPLLCRGLARRGLDARPFLLALAASVNAGSAATLIGNPQNILIGQAGGLGFIAYSRVAVLPSIAALGVIFVVVAWLWRDTLSLAGNTATPFKDTPPAPANEEAASTLDWTLTAKSALAVVVLIVLLAAVDARALAALAVAAILLWSRRLPTRDVLAKVDGALLVMIGSLFAITATTTRLPIAQHAAHWLSAHHWMPLDALPVSLFSLVASNSIGNVPAVVLLLGAVQHANAHTLTALALQSTLAGNFLITGSLANIILAERAASVGVRLGFMDFARTGVPITLISMALATGWLCLIWGSAA